MAITKVNSTVTNVTELSSALLNSNDPNGLRAYIDGRVTPINVTELTQDLLVPEGDGSLRKFIEDAVDAGGGGGGTVGADSYDIEISSAAILKDAIDAATAANHTEITVQGIKNTSTGVEYYGIIKIYDQNNVELLSQDTTSTDPFNGFSPNALAFSPQSTSTSTRFTIKLFSTDAPMTLLATRIVPVQYAMGSILVVNDNQNHFFSITDQNVSSYDYSGTNVRVYEGNVELEFVYNNPQAGQWTIQPQGTNIIPGAISKITDPLLGAMGAIIGVHSSFSVGTLSSASVASITYIISGKTKGGAAFSNFTRQNFRVLSAPVAEAPPVFTIDSDLYAIIRTSASNPFPSISIQGKRHEAGQSAPFGFIRIINPITSDVMVDRTNTATTPFVFSLASDYSLEQSSVVVELYETDSSLTVLDTLKLLVDTSPERLNVSLNNPNHVFPATSLGDVTTYDLSGTKIWVSHGTDELQFAPISSIGSLQPGEWTLSGITSSQTSLVDDITTDINLVEYSALKKYATVPDYSVVSDDVDVARVTFYISGKKSSGEVFTLVAEQNFTKAKGGGDIKIYDILLNSYVVAKTQQGGLEAYSPIIVQGREHSAEGTVGYGYVVVWAVDPITEALVAIPGGSGDTTAAPISVVLPPDSPSRSVEIRLYNTEEDATNAVGMVPDTLAIDSSRIPVLSPVSAIQASLSNPNHQFPATSLGEITSYDHSGTDVWMYDGLTKLEYAPTELNGLSSNPVDWGAGVGTGKWTMSEGISSITASANDFTTVGLVTPVVVGGETHARVGAHDGLGSGIRVATITFNVFGKSINGEPFTFTIMQKFVKVEGGGDVIVYSVSTSSSLITKDAIDAATDGDFSSISIQGKKHSGGGVTENFGWISVTGNTETPSTTLIDTAISPYVFTPDPTSDSTVFTVKMYDGSDVGTSLEVDYTDIPVQFKSGQIIFPTFKITNESLIFVRNLNNEISPAAGLTISTEQLNFEGAVTYKWFKNNIEIVGETGFEYIVPTSDYANDVITNTYKCQVTGPFGDQTSFSLNSYITIPLLESGSSTITIDIVPPFHVIAGPPEGFDLNLAGKSSTISVWIGSELLNYSTNTSAPNSWNVTSVTPTNVVMGTPVTTSTTYRLAPGTISSDDSFCLLTLSVRDGSGTVAVKQARVSYSVARGTNAPSFRITNSAAVFAKDPLGTSLRPSTIELDTYVQNFPGTVVRYQWASVSGTTTIDIPGATSTNYIVDVDDYPNGALTATFSCTAKGMDGTTELISMTDTITIPVVLDGTNTITIKSGNSSVPLAAPTTGYEDVDFSGNSSPIQVQLGVVDLPYVSSFGAYTSPSWTVDSLVKDGIIATGSGSGNMYTLIPTGITQESATCVINVRVRTGLDPSDLHDYPTTISYALSRAGAVGSAASFSINNGSTLFVKDASGTTAPASVTISTFTSAHFTTKTYQWYKNGTIIPGATNNSYTIVASSDYTPGIKTNSYKCTVTGLVDEVSLSLSDTITVPLVEDGVQGPDGEDAISVINDNENYSLGAPATGWPSNFGGNVSRISVYKGSTLVPYNSSSAVPNSWSMVSLVPSSGFTVSGAAHSSGAYYTVTPSTLTADSASCVVNVSIRGASGSTAAAASTTISVSITRTGVAGVPGDDGADGSSQDIIFRRSATVPTTPAPSSSVPSLWFSSVAGAAAGTGPLYSCFGSKVPPDTVYTWELPIAVEGTSVAEVVIYKRSATAISSPPSGGTYVFYPTPTATPPSTWTVAVPSGTDPVYSSRAVVSGVFSNTSALPLTGWSTPVKVFESGEDGNDGKNASAFSITSYGSFRQDQLGVITPSGISLTTAIQNITSPTYAWKKGTTTISGATSSSYSVPSTDFASAVSNSYTCTVTGMNGISAVSLSDTVTIPKLVDGSDSVTVENSNENITFTAPYGTAFTGIVYTGNTSVIRVYSGSTQLNYATSGASTWSVTISNSGIASTGVAGANLYTVTPTGMSAESASTTLTITVRNAQGVASTHSTTVSYSLSRAPVPAINAAEFSITSQGIFNKSKLGVITPTNISLTTAVQNINSPTYVWKKGTTAISGATASSYTVLQSDYSSVSSNTYTCTVSGTNSAGGAISLSDTTTIPMLVDGSDAVTVDNSNENITFTAPAGTAYTGIVYTGNTSIIQVYSGSTQLNYATTGASTWNASHSNSGISSTGTASTNAYTITPAGMSAENASTVITVTVRNASGVASTYSTTISYSLSRAGQGKSSTIAFLKSTSATAADQAVTSVGPTSVPASNSWSLGTGTWSNSTYTNLVAGEYLWQTDGVYDPSTNTTTWTKPYWSSLKVGALESITSNTGNLTYGSSTVLGSIKSYGNTGYGNPGTFLGYSTGSTPSVYTPVFSMGTGTGAGWKGLKFDGANLEVTGTLSANAVNAVNTANITTEAVTTPRSATVGSTWINLPQGFAGSWNATWMPLTTPSITTVQANQNVLCMFSVEVGVIGGSDGGTVNFEIWRNTTSVPSGVLIQRPAGSTIVVGSQKYLSFGASSTVTAMCIDTPPSQGTYTYSVVGIAGTASTAYHNGTITLLGTKR